MDKGMEDSQKITFTEEGDQEPGLEPGDIIIVLDEKQHELYKRNGMDLIMKMDISLREALCGFKKIINTLDDRTLVIQTIPGEVIKTGDFKSIQGEGMPQYRNPFEKGRLIISFNVVFPDRLESDIASKIAAILPAEAEPMIPDDHEEVDLNDFDPKADRAQQQARNQYDEDDEGHGHGAHGPGVSCATQ